MQIVAWETAPQIALRNYSTEVGIGGEDSIYVILVKGEYIVIKHMFFL